MRRANIIILSLLVLLLGGAKLHAQAQASVNIAGAETPVSGGWDAGNISLTLTNISTDTTYTEHIHYGQYSTQASVASNFAALFAWDYRSSLTAKANGSTITFGLKNGTVFSPVYWGGPTTSFHIDTTSWPTQGDSAYPATVALSASLLPASGSIYTNVTLSATVTSPAGVPAGVVHFYDYQIGVRQVLGSAAVVNGVATFTAQLLPGLHTFKAAFSGAGYIYAQATLQVQIKSYYDTSTPPLPGASQSTFTTVSADQQTTNFGDPVNISADISTNGLIPPTGQVNLSETPDGIAATLPIHGYSGVNYIGNSDGTDWQVLNNDDNFLDQIPGDNDPVGRPSGVIICYDTGGLGTADVSVYQDIPMSLSGSGIMTYDMSVPYTFSVWLRTTEAVPWGSSTNAFAPAVTTDIALYDSTGSPQPYQVQSIQITDVWQRFSITAYLLPTTTTARIQIGGYGTLEALSDNIEIGSSQLEAAVPGPYVPTSGTASSTLSTTNWLPFSRQPDWVFQLAGNGFGNLISAADYGHDPVASWWNTPAPDGSFTASEAEFDNDTPSLLSASIPIYDPNKQYLFSAWVRNFGNMASPVLSLACNSSEGVIIPLSTQAVTLNAYWTRISVASGPLSNSCTSLIASFGGQSAGVWNGSDYKGRYLIWGPQLELTTGGIPGPYVATNDVPAAATVKNLLPDSETVAGWTASGSAALGSTSTRDPNGGTTAFAIAGTGSYTVMQSGGTAKPGAAYMFSVWLRAASGTPSVVVQSGDSTGTSLPPNNNTVTPTANWTRYSFMSKLSPSAATVNAIIASAGGSTGTVEVWGAELSMIYPGTQIFTNGAPAEGAGGRASYSTSSLSQNTHTISASYGGDGFSQPSSSATWGGYATVIVGPPPVPPVITALSCSPSNVISTLSMVCTATLPGITSGTVTFTVNGGRAQTVAITSGSASATFSGTPPFSPGSADVDATYSGNGQTVSTIVNVVDPVTVPYGTIYSMVCTPLFPYNSAAPGSFSCTVWMPGVLSGSVLFTVAGLNGVTIPGVGPVDPPMIASQYSQSVPVSSEVGTFTSMALYQGIYTVTATSLFTGSTQTATMYVDALAPNGQPGGAAPASITSVSCEQSDFTSCVATLPGYIGGPVDFAITGPNGYSAGFTENVAYGISSTPWFNLTGGPGVYNVTATLAGFGTWGPTTATTTIGTPGLLGMSCTPTTLIVGVDTGNVCTASLSADLGGTVTFTIGSTTTPVSVTGTTVVSPTLPIGASAGYDYTITATYSVDGSSAAQTISVQNPYTPPVPTLAQLTCTPGTLALAAGAQTVCTAALSVTGTGTVTFTDGYAADTQTVSVTNGTAVSGGMLGGSTAAGEHTVTAVYSGDSSSQTYIVTELAAGSGGPSPGGLVDPCAGAPTPCTLYAYSIWTPGTPPTIDDDTGGYTPGTPPSSGYDAVGNVISYIDSVNGNWVMPLATSPHPGYDTVNRLTNAVYTPAGSASVLYMCWAYDAQGNRLNQIMDTTSGCQSGSPASFQASTVNSANNQIVTSSYSGPSGSGAVNFTYDASGNVTFDGQNSYLYDAAGQLCASQSSIGGTITQYLYDADGARVAKGNPAGGSTTLACADPDNLSNFTATTIYMGTQEYAGDGVTLLRTYVDDATIDGDGTIHYQLHDWQGNRRMQVSANGVVEGTYSNLPFGDGLVVAGDDSDKKHFTGKERDTETATANGHDGLDYFGARYDSSNIGRWTQPDWSAKEDPVPYAKLADPQSLNLYGYVANNPLSTVDVDGHVCAYVYGNGGSGFCKRSEEYAKMDANASINSQTRFFAAASAVSALLADAATWKPARALVVSKATATFLEGIGETLEKFNQNIAKQITSGQLGGAGLDQQLVHQEQTTVQGVLDNLKSSDPDAYTKRISEINILLNPSKGKELISNAIGDDDSNSVLNEVREDLGHPLDFSNQKDREAIGNALIKHEREKEKEKEEEDNPPVCSAAYGSCGAD